MVCRRARILAQCDHLSGIDTLQNVDIDTPLLLENQDWKSWKSLFGAHDVDPLSARRALESVGRRFRKQLGLREDPFTFRHSENGELEVRTSGIAGTVSAGNVVIDIAPKFALRQ